jgi:hypothetical protein
MATTQSKHAKLNADFNSKSNTLIFPGDLLGDGNDQMCLTFFINTIRNGKAKLTFDGGLSSSKNSLTSPYGEMPVIHAVSRGLQKAGGIESFSNTFVRSDQSITLPMPKGLEFNTKANWASTDLGAAAFALDQGKDLMDMKANGNGGALAKQLGLNAVGSIASSFGGVKGKELVELGTATVTNNYAETMFKSVENRSFNWSWTLTPRNSKEAEAIDTILRVLRFHQLPEFKENVGNGNAFLLYPSSVDVVFWDGGKPNRYLPRISTCAITSITTNYAPQSQFVKTTIGSPVSYNLAISLTELSVLHKGLIGTDAAGVGATF